MFDISFGELMLIGVIALVVIGPQRLPTVARTLGHLIGRAQRYVNDVKHDIQKEIDLEEINKVKSQMESAARSVQSSVREVGENLSKPIAAAQQAIHGACTEVQSSLNLHPVKTDEASAATPSTATSAPIDADDRPPVDMQTDTTTHTHAEPDDAPPNAVTPQQRSST